MALLDQTAQETLMSVLQIPVRMLESVSTRLMVMFATVQMVSMVQTVRMTFINVPQILVQTMQLV
jgi:hypothetical protein